MRISTHMQSLAAFAVVAAPLAVEAPAHAAQFTKQVGAGVALSIALGDREPRGLNRGRVGFRVHGFAETGPTSQPTDDPKLLVGGELGFRAIPGVEQRFEFLGRAGVGAVHLGWRGYFSHRNVFVPRLSGGVAIGTSGMPSGLVSLDLRLPGSYLRVLNSVPVRRTSTLKRNFAFAEVGGELGFIPAVWDHGVDGRPLRDQAGSRVPIVLTEHAPLPRSEGWLRAGTDELEAVTAFLNLAQELRSLGAPAVLIGRCLDAADDEAAHAILCFGRAAELGAGRVVALPLRPAARPVGTRKSALHQLARESWFDGYLNEGRAAAALQARARAARDDRDARIYARIAGEERAHARLGLDVARWCTAA